MFFKGLDEFVIHRVLSLRVLELLRDDVNNFDRVRVRLGGLLDHGGGFKRGLGGVNRFGRVAKRRRGQHELRLEVVDFGERLRGRLDGVDERHLRVLQLHE